ncbi:translesion error-prone DNA polymerase V autoproteolytic subunit [Gemmatimonas aurantiaca]|nr:translesion error-prone DNA polymerase V autoproteolytic subunit [Gemmatimonas aurantiaca]
MKPKSQPNKIDKERDPSDHPPLASATVSAGFPSPADDYLDGGLDLNELLITRPAATFFVRARGNSMSGDRSAINDGDLLIVDRSLEANNGAIVIAVVDGELTVKRLRRAHGQVELLAANPAYPAICFGPDDNNNNCEIWGVVTCVIHQL